MIRVIRYQFYSSEIFKIIEKMRFYSTKYVFAIISVSSKRSYDFIPIHERCDLLRICRTACCTACCRTNPQQIEANVVWV